MRTCFFYFYNFIIAFKLWNNILPTVLTTNFSTTKASNLITSNSVLNDGDSSLCAYSLLETQKLAKMDVNSSVDGFYQFSRKAGCLYRQSRADFNENLFSTTTTETTMNNNTKQRSVLLPRGRFGRGGRLIFDLII